MQVRKTLENGQILGISGNIPELGMWKEFKFHLKKQQGDLWYTDKPILTKKRYFCYKYVILHGDGTLNNWERGVDRIADLEILDEKQTLKQEHDPKQPVKTVLLDDEWE